jgi:dTDP-4-dehydrorhamnose reductase
MSRAKRAIVLGGRTGLLGQALATALAGAGWEVRPTSRTDLDPFDAAAVSALLAEFKPERVFNTIAYTAVDLAEDESEAAYRLNRDLPALLGRLCEEAGTALVHYSTDFVFDGDKDAPYVEDDQVNPQCVYGASKLAGEEALLGLGLDETLIIRISWLFGPGKTNFVEKILGFAKSREALKVVADQIGSPSYTPELAAISLALVEAGAKGVFHAACSGQASWRDLAAEAVAQAGLPCEVLPIPSSDYPQKAKRPAYSVFDLKKLTAATGMVPCDWRDAVRRYVRGDLGLGPKS